MYKLNTIFSCFILVFCLLIYLTGPKYEALLFNYLFINDEVGFIVKLFILVFSLFYFYIFFILSPRYVVFEYNLLILLGITGLFLLIASFDMISVYLSLELQSLCFYILVSFNYMTIVSIESCLKYFILGALAGGFLLFGMSLFYGFLGMSNFFDFFIFFEYLNFINIEILKFKYLLFSWLFVQCGLWFKLGIFPFHQWVADIYSSTKTIIVLFFATIPHLSILLLLIRLNLLLVDLYLKYMFIIFCLLSICSILVGTFGALYQIDFRRIYAFSSISNMGYVLSFFFLLSNETISNIIVYTVIYNIISLALWLILLTLKDHGTEIKFKEIKELFLVYNSNKYISILFILFLFSAMGIPPLLGFFNKLYVFMNSIQLKLYLYSLFILFLSSVGVVYYLRFVKLLVSYVVEKFIFIIPLNEGLFYYIYILFFINILYFYYPIHLNLFIQNLKFFLFN